MRPSEHSGNFVRFHVEREEAAIAAGFLHRECPAMRGPALSLGDVLTVKGCGWPFVVSSLLTQHKQIDARAKMKPGVIDEPWLVLCRGVEPTKAVLVGSVCEVEGFGIRRVAYAHEEFIFEVV